MVSNMEEPIQAALAAFISNCEFKKIPEHFKEDARLRVLDWLGCAIAGAHYPQVKITGGYLGAAGGAAEARAFGIEGKIPVRTAAFVNGVAGHVCELDDGHRTAIGHPGSITVPVALALAERHGLSGEEVLKAVIIGYDMFSRLGRTVNPTHYRTWHTTGTCGTIAAAATAASLLGLTPEETNNAIGIACTMAGGLIESFGTHAKAVNIAEACQNGIDAAYLAKAGMTGSHSALLGKKGFVAATCTDPHIENLKDPSEETLVSDTAFFKVYASCGHTNSPLDALFELIRTKHPDPDQIESIAVKTYRVSVDVAGQLKCATEDEAKFSIPYCFAIALRYGTIALPQFTEEVRTDPKVLDLARRVTVTEDPEATSLFPRRVAEVTVRMKDGTEFVKKVWNSNDKAEAATIEAKFRAAAEGPLGEEAARELQKLAESVDTLPSVLPVIDLMMKA